MKKIKYNEKTVGELHEAEKEARKALLTNRVETEQRKTKNLHAVSDKKKELARILTALRAKELAK